MMIVFAYLFVMILVLSEMVHISDNAGTAGLVVFGVPYIWMFWARYSRSQ